MSKKVIKEIFCGTLAEHLTRGYNLGFIINGIDLRNRDIKEGAKILKENNLIKNNNDIIIPIGLILTSKVKTHYPGIYTFNFNNGFIITDLGINDYKGCIQ